MYIFLDESGNFKSKNKEDYFIVGGFVTGQPDRTIKMFRKWQHTKFPKKLRYKTEVKFSDTGLTEKMRLKTLEYFTQHDLRIFYSFLHKANIPLEYRQAKQLKSGLLYAEIVAQTIHLLLPTTATVLRIFRDTRHLSKISQAKFNEIIKLNLLPNLCAKTLIQIKVINSATNLNIQIADWVCGALFRYHNKRKNSKQYFSILKSSIIESKEMFEKYWEDPHKNKKSPHKS